MLLVKCLILEFYFISLKINLVQIFQIQTIKVFKLKKKKLKIN